MAETSEGWDGTVDEAGIARILSAAAPGIVSGPGDFRASVVAGQRRVVLTPGESGHSFIRYADTSPRTIDLDVPSVGRWDLIVQRRDWAANTVSTVVLKGVETGPTLPLDPTEPPAGFNDNPGVSADLPLWWAWVNAANNNVVLRDARKINYPLGSPLGHAGMTGGFQIIPGTSPVDVLIAAAQRLRGGVQFLTAGGGLPARLVVPDDGLYRINAHFYWLAGAGRWYGGYVHVNNATPALLGAHVWQGNENDVTSHVSAIQYLSAGSYVSLKVDGRGTAPSTYGTTGYNGTFLEVERL